MKRKTKERIEKREKEMRNKERAKEQLPGEGEEAVTPTQTLTQAIEQTTSEMAINQTPETPRGEHPGSPEGGEKEERVWEVNEEELEGERRKWRREQEAIDEKESRSGQLSGQDTMEEGQKGEGGGERLEGGGGGRGQPTNRKRNIGPTQMRMGEPPVKKWKDREEERRFEREKLRGRGIMEAIEVR